MFLQLIEQDIKRHYQGLEEKFYIHAQPNKAKKLANILAKLEADPMLKDSTDMSQQENQQHDIRVRILSLLLNLSKIKWPRWGDKLTCLLGSSVASSGDGETS